MLSSSAITAKVGNYKQSRAFLAKNALHSYIYMLKNCYIVFLFLTILFSKSYSQSFSVNTTTVEMVRPSSFFVMYDPIEIRNLTDEVLNLRWKRLSSGHGQTQAPAQWDIAVQDPSNYYNPANNLDSADFTLLTGENGVSFFILQLFPNDSPGEHLYRYQIYDPNNLEDIVNLSIDFTVNAVTSIRNEKQGAIDLLRTPGASSFSLNNNSNQHFNGHIITSHGQTLKSFYLPPKSDQSILLNHFPKGLYWIIAQSKTDQTYWIKKIILP